MEKIVNLSFLGSKPATKPALETLDVNIETLGREHAGKSGGKKMMFRIVQQGPLPSGLDLSPKDPRTLVKLMNESIAQYRNLQKTGFISTTDPELIEYRLFEGDKLKAVLKLRESLGQLLTFTDDGSDKRMQEQFDKHHDNLAAADVIHVYVSCPANDHPSSLERLQNDLAILRQNLCEVLNLRKAGRKSAVALVVSKPDGPYATLEDAKLALNDETLRRMLHRLVLLLEGSEKVGLGAIFVMSSFGYGKARLLEPSVANGSHAPQKGFSLLSDGEPEWILKENELPMPHNLTGLVWWTIMAGLALKPVGAKGDEMARTAQMLLDDLKAMDAWFVPLNCRVTR